MTLPSPQDVQQIRKDNQGIINGHVLGCAKKEMMMGKKKFLIDLRTLKGDSDDAANYLKLSLVQAGWNEKQISITNSECSLHVYLDNNETVTESHNADDFDIYDLHGYG